MISSEVARITDEKGRFFFVQPIAVFTGRDGSVYVQEYQQLLKFDAQGRFVKNLLKKGSGPGELNDNLTDVLILEKEIILWSSNSLKLIRVNLDGRLIADKTSPTPLGSLLGTYGGRFFFLKREIVELPKARISGIFENDYRLVIFNERGETVPTPFLMPCTATLYFRNRIGFEQHDFAADAPRCRRPLGLPFPCAGLPHQAARSRDRALSSGASEGSTIGSSMPPRRRRAIRPSSCRSFTTIFAGSCGGTIGSGP